MYGPLDHMISLLPITVMPSLRLVPGVSCQLVAITEGKLYYIACHNNRQNAVSSVILSRVIQPFFLNCISSFIGLTSADRSNSACKTRCCKFNNSKFKLLIIVR